MITSTLKAFKSLNIDKNTLSTKQKSFLKKEGYLILKPSKFVRENLNNLKKIINNLILLEGDRGGWEGKEKYYKKGKKFEENCDRLGNLIDKNLIFGKLILIPEVLAAAHEVIRGDLKVGGLNFRNPHAGYGEQSIHIDALPRKSKREKFHGVVCFLSLDDSNISNGATRIIPKTHKKLGWPDDYIKTEIRQKNEIRTTVKAGSIVVMNLNTWHAGAKNISGKKRRTIFIQIKRRNEEQLLNYKKYISSNTKKKLSDVQKYLLGIRKIDKKQKIDSYSIGQQYRAKFKKDRNSLNLK